MSEDTCLAYNIVPLDAPVTENATTAFPEVQGAVAALKYSPCLPKLPAEFPIPATRNADMFDFLHYIFGFQVCLFLESFLLYWEMIFRVLCMC